MGRDGNSIRTVREIILFAQFAVDVSRHLGRRGALHAPRIPAKQNSQGNFRVRFIRIANEPADA